jgi:hypothetical protein
MHVDRPRPAGLFSFPLGREDPCRKTDVGRRFTCALPVIFGVTDRYRLSKTSYCTFGHVLKQNAQTSCNRQTDGQTDTRTIWNESGDVKVTSCIIPLVRGKTSQFFVEIPYNSDKACFGPAPKITIIRTRSHRGYAPCDFDTGIIRRTRSHRGNAPYDFDTGSN